MRRTKIKNKSTGEAGTPRGLYGAGSIDALPSGRFRVRVRLPSGARVTELVDTRAEAEALRAALVIERREMVKRGELEGATARDRAPEAITLKAYGARWLDARELAGAHRSIHNERSVWRTHIERSALATMDLGEITRRDVRAWMRDLCAKRARRPVPGKPTELTTRTLSRSVLTHCLSLLRQCFAGAQQEELIEENPAKEVMLPRAAGETAGTGHARPNIVGQMVPKPAKAQCEDVRRSFPVAVEAPRGVESPRDPSVTRLALAVLKAIDEGTPAGPVARDLAVAVLRSSTSTTEVWDLALSVIEGGAQRLRHAVNLAGLVLDTGERGKGVAQ